MSTSTSEPGTDAWEPSAHEREREAYRRKQTIRSAAIAAVSTIVVVGGAALAVVSSPGWPRVQETYFSWDKAVDSFPAVLDGLWLNIRVTVLCALLILLVSLTVAIARTLRGPVAFPLRLLGTAYVDTFRGLPLLLVLFLLGFGGPALELQGLPTSALFWGASALVLSYSAYVAEVFRAGIESVHASQRLASRSLGLSHAQTLRHVVLPQAVPRGLLFLTGGSGITPVMGMRRNHDLRERDAVHIHSAPTAADVIFAEELRRESPGVRTHVRHTDDEGMLDPTALDVLVPDWRERETWLCGPTPMLDAFEAVWAEAGIADRLHVERFRPAITATGEGGRISLTTGAERTEVEADGATTVLDAAEDAGVIMPSGCRMGVCFGCVLPMTDGAVRDLRNGTLTETTPDDPPVKVQTCISAVAGSCTIETTES